MFRVITSNSFAGFRQCDAMWMWKIDDDESSGVEKLFAFSLSRIIVRFHLPQV